MALASWNERTRVRRAALIATTLLVLCLCGVAANLATSYLFRSAGNYPKVYETIPLGVSLAHTVGYFLQFSGKESAYIQTGSNFVRAQPVGITSAYLSGINASGIAVGGYCPNAVCNPLSGEHGYTYDINTGAITTIDFPGIINATTAYGINDLGEVVGGYCPASFTCAPNPTSPTAKGFLFAGGVFTTIRFPGSDATQASAINNAGVIVGDYIALVNLTGPHGFLYRNGVYKNIDFPGANITEPNAINNAGVVAGYFQDKQLNIHGFTYQAGKFTQIDMPGALGTAIRGINDANQLVGVWFPTFGVANFRAIPARSQPQLAATEP